ncbi:MAG: hypothetical protein E7563_03225 [Ruminococcaceae bacterium]|nr:hypothetical protein [Oscillospiraceae bacterium]
MKFKVVLCFCIVMLIILFSMMDVCAVSDESYISDYDVLSEMSDTLDLNSLYNELPEEAKLSLINMGITQIGPSTLDGVTFTSLINELLNSVKKESTSVFSAFTTFVAVILIYALFEGFAHSITGDTLREVLSVVCALCLACALIIPVTDIIDSAVQTIHHATDFMLAFVPVMVAVLISCGKSLSSSGYYALMVGAAQGISQLSDKVITPMLNVFLGVNLCSTIIPQVNLSGLSALFSKTIKWLLSFSFTIFSALLTFKTLISTSIDTVSTRAVRYTVSSFIPVVGTALAEAYKTVQGSVNILKNGMGIFVIFAVGAVFLPVIVRLFLWSLSISLSRTVAQIINLRLPVEMMQGVSTVLSVLMAVVICIMALYIISTALIITAGGNGV